MGYPISILRKAQKELANLPTEAYERVRETSTGPGTRQDKLRNRNSRRRYSAPSRREQLGEGQMGRMHLYASV